MMFHLKNEPLLEFLFFSAENAGYTIAFGSREKCTSNVRLFLLGLRPQFLVDFKPIQIFHFSTKVPKYRPKLAKYLQYAVFLDSEIELTLVAKNLPPAEYCFEPSDSGWKNQADSETLDWDQTFRKIQNYVFNIYFVKNFR